jgi:hypothetical protein
MVDLLLLLVRRGFDKKARQSLDYDPFLMVVELFPKARLRNGNVGEVQIQLWHGSPGLHQMLMAGRRNGAGVHRRYREGASGHPANR